MNPTPHAIAALALFCSPQFSKAFLRNAAIQLAVFTPVSLIPGWRTERMSYVDVSWPAGLVSIALQLPFLSSDGNWLRKALATAAYLIQGGRMLSGALNLWSLGHLNREMPRYVYQRIRWARKGIVPGSAWYKPQLVWEVYMQALANTCFLAVPGFILGTDTASVGASEAVGWCCWLGSIWFEHTPDLQKLAFLQQQKREGRVGSVCNVGFWSRSRHPNCK